MLTGHAQATVSRWERGAWIPSPWDLHLLRALAAAPAGLDVRGQLQAWGPIYTLSAVLSAPQAL